MKMTKIGIVGCGNISSIYFENIGKTFENIEVIACSDLDLEKAKAQAEKYEIPRFCTTEELLAIKEIDIVINLTTPLVHGKVNRMILEAGKNVHVEKPLDLNLENAKEILILAKKKGLRVGCAPDTFMGGGIQTCRKLIDDGVIGDVLGATAFMTTPGHESWHPDPDFFYKAGGGPMLDVGPYYITALVSLMGPVKRVAGITTKSYNERTITSEKKKGQKIQVDIPTHQTGVLEFANGAVGSVIMSFDVWAAELPCIEIYGTKGSLSVPDPNTFGGPVKLFKKNSKEWIDIPIFGHGYTENSRGLAVADMADAMERGREHRANGELAYHVLETMLAFDSSSSRSEYITINSTCERPAVLPIGLDPGFIE